MRETLWTFLFAAPLVQIGGYSGTLRAMTDRSGKPAGSALQPAEQHAPPAEPQEFVPSAEPDGTPRELGGPAGPEPTRFGDWERKGRCIDF